MNFGLYCKYTKTEKINRKGNYIYLTGCNRKIDGIWKYCPFCGKRAVEKANKGEK